MRRLILRSLPSSGDVVMLTAAVRDLHAARPGQIATDVRTFADDLWLQRHVGLGPDADGHQGQRDRGHYGECRSFLGHAGLQPRRQYDHNPQARRSDAVLHRNLRRLEPTRQERGRRQQGRGVRARLRQTPHGQEELRFRTTFERETAGESRLLETRPSVRRADRPLPLPALWSSRPGCSCARNSSRSFRTEGALRIPGRVVAHVRSTPGEKNVLHRTGPWS